MKHKQLPFIKARKNHLIILTLLTIVPVFAILLSLGSRFIAEATHNGDASLIHVCKDTRGGVTIVGDSDSCNTGETEVTWLKYIADGLITTAKLANGAVTQEKLASGVGVVARYEDVGSSLTSPNSTWQDIPDLSLVQTFNTGTIKATYTGRVIRSGGDSTAYIRLKVQKTGDSPSYVGDIYVFRSSSASSGETSSIPFMVQKVISVTAG